MVTITLQEYNEILGLDNQFYGFIIYQQYAVSLQRVEQIDEKYNPNILESSACNRWSLNIDLLFNANLQPIANICQNMSGFWCFIYGGQKL